MSPYIPRYLAAATLSLLAACSDASGPEPVVPSCTAADGGNVVQLAPFQTRTFRASELNRCVWVTGNGARYVVVPQFPTENAIRSPVRFTLASGGSLATTTRAADARSVSPALHLDNVLRQIEHRLAGEAAREAPELRALSLSTHGMHGPALQQVGSTRTFKVLSKIPASDNEQLTFATITATLRFAGQNILIYIDQQSPGGGFTDAVITKLGTWFDQDLYPIGVNTFGSESDLDANDRVIVLMTPVVNALTSKDNCDVVIAGFFFGLDFTQDPNSNRGEVFYSLVPDPDGVFSCPRSAATVEASAPPTFIHEFQHMISYNQHVLVRDGADEETWLNEGLSHVAEEVVARFYENKYPPIPGQGSLFSSNDTARVFIINDITNSYQFLESTTGTSLTLFERTGTLEERGAAWLFLRWLADQKDSTIFGRLVQTSLTSVANVENVAGESFPALFGDWALALWTDSIPGHPRESVPPRNRFKSRNLRVIYARLHAAAPQNFPRPYPLSPRALPFGSGLERSMLPGTMEHFSLASSASDPAVGLRFVRPDGQALPDALRPQLGVFRVP